MIASLVLSACLLAATSGAPLPSDPPIGFQEAVVLEGLTSPSAFDFTPDGRMVISERVDGRLRVATQAAGGHWALESQPYGTFEVPTSGGVPTAHRSSGLRSIAFDPDFESNGWVYAFHMRDNPRHNRVVRMRQDPANANRLDPGSLEVLIDLPFNAGGSSGSHNGGALRFGPDGMLYITTGDGWTGGDSVQSLSTFTGKVLRIRPDGSIPADNPFYGVATGDYRAIFALGLRNPYTLSFNPATGWLLIGEANGADKADLLRVEAGANYGHQGYGGIGVPRSRWVNGAAAGNKLVTGGAWYPNGGPFPAEYHGAYFVALWGTNGADGGPPGQISYVHSSTDTAVTRFAADVGSFDGAGTRLKPVHLRVGPDGALYYLLTSYLTGAGQIVRVSFEGLAQVATPTFSPAGGSFTDPVAVEITSATPGAMIRWTADGSEPTPNARPYSTPIRVPVTATLRARAFIGSTESAVATADFVIGGGPNVPPIANAGPDQIVAIDSMVILNGAATTDPDGNDLFLSEQWTQVAGPPVRLSNTDETTAYFTPTETGRYRFRIDVTDGTDTDHDVTVVEVRHCVNDITEGLVARWAFDEASGTTALDSGGGLWNGKLEGAAWTGMGIGGGALDFDGSSAVVQLGSPDLGGDAMTLSGWIRIDDFGVGDARILSKASGVAESEHYWMLSTVPSGNDHRLRFRLRAGGSTTTLIASEGDLQTGRWIHVAAVYDGSHMKLFLDARRVGRTPKAGDLDTSPTVPAAIGNQPEGSRPLDGLIDDLRVYSRALSRRELAVLAGFTRRIDCPKEGPPPR